jgi:hypothetical protein
MCHYHGYQGRRVAIGLESPKHGWLLHQGAAATTIDLAIDLVMSANPSVASQSGPDLSTISSVARLAFLKLDARISANSPYQTNPSSNRARLTASLLRTDHLDRHVVRRLGRSQRSLHLPATLSTSPPNGSVNGDAVSAAAAASR